MECDETRRCRRGVPRLISHGTLGPSRPRKHDFRSSGTLPNTNEKSRACRNCGAKRNRSFAGRCVLPPLRRATMPVGDLFPLCSGRARRLLSPRGAGARANVSHAPAELTARGERRNRSPQLATPPRSDLTLARTQCGTHRDGVREHQECRHVVELDAPHEHL